MRRFCDCLERHGKSYTIHVYRDAPHGWLNDTVPGRYRRVQAEAAWAQQRVFLREVLAPDYGRSRRVQRYAAGTAFDYDFASNVRMEYEARMARDFEDHCWKDIVDDEIIEIYEPYRREVRVGCRPAVLAIDLYNKVYRGGNRPVREVNRRYSGSCGEHAWKALEPTRQLFAAARSAGIPVIYTTRHADTDGVHSTHRRMQSETEELYRIKEELAPMPGDLVIYKERASGFFGTPLIAHLRKLGAESLIICGESTSGCVRASTVDAYSYGFHNVVVEECTYDRSLLSHKVNLFDLHHKYADVMHVEEVIEHLEGLSRGRSAA